MSSVPRAIKPSVNGWQGDYLDAQYQRFKEDPGSVPEDLRSFFQGFDLASAMGGPPAGPQGGESYGGESFQAGVSDLITAYREWGHFAAQLDPFGRPRPRPAALELAYHGLTPADLDRVVEAGTARGSVIETLGKTIARLEATYCRCIGAEFMHIQNAEERDWIIERAERNEGMVAVNRETKFHILEQLLRAECFETFCQKKYPGEKRFSLEGGESLIPFLNHVCEQSVEFGVQEIVLAMAHRGRLNVLNNVLGKTWEQIFTEFEDNWEEDFVDGGGDVKYHRGYSGRREFPGGKILRLALASNPSHLESVNAVVAGRCRAKQRLRADVTRTRVVPVVVHGDAAVIGQGIVAEMLNLSQLEGYTTGGTIHVVANNLIGFTTSPEDARSSPYCTDIAKMIDDLPRDASVVVLGDFNAGEDNPAMARLKSSKPEGPPRLADTFRVLHPDANVVGTFNGFQGTEDGAKIDYILTRPSVHVLKAEIIKTQSDGRFPSDHFPVNAELRFQPAQ